MGDDFHRCDDIELCSLDVARDGTQCNTQGVWPCKLLIDSLPLQLFSMSPDLMKALRKQPR